MGKLREWTLFPQAVIVQAEDEETAIAMAKTRIQFLLSSNELEFEEVVDEGEVEEDLSREIDDKEIDSIVSTEHKQKEFPDDEDY